MGESMARLGMKPRPASPRPPYQEDTPHRFAEVSTLLDSTGHIALHGANLMFEILCVVADAVAQRRT